MGREHLQNSDVSWGLEPWRSGVSAERCNWWEPQPAALCRDAATGSRFMESSVFLSGLLTAHEPKMRKPMEINERIFGFMESGGEREDGNRLASERFYRDCRRSLIK